MGRRMGHWLDNVVARSKFRTQLKTALGLAVLLHAGAVPRRQPRAAIHPAPSETTVPKFLDNVRRPESSIRTGKALAASQLRAFGVC